MARKIVKKLSKEQKSLLIGLLIGDGTISNNYVFKLSHSILQKEYLEWKIKLLDKYKIKNNGLKGYTSTCGFNKGKGVIYSQLSINPTIKALRRSIYSKENNNQKIIKLVNPTRNCNLVYGRWMYKHKYFKATFINSTYNKNCYLCGFRNN